MRTVGIFLHVSRQPNSVAAFITVHRELRSIIPHMLQLAQDHADMLLCKVAGAVTRKGDLYMVFLKVPVPRLLPSQLVEPVSPQPRGKRLYGNFLWHVHITALSRFYGRGWNAGLDQISSKNP